METARERNLKAGLPYIRQVVTYLGKEWTVMVYDFCSETNVQLAQGRVSSAQNWNTARHKWIPYKHCLLNVVDRTYITAFRDQAIAAQEGTSPSRKPMPPPVQVHKRKNRPSRQKVKARLRKAHADE